MKAGMRDSFIKEDGLDWDTILPDKLRDMWVNYMQELVEAGQLVFGRCVRPEGEVLEFVLVAYFDGSDQAYAAVVYCRWEMVDGSVHVSLLCSKANVSPLQRISTPRGELNGAVMVVRLVWTVVQALEMEELPSRVVFGGDSETVLAAREKACGALGEYFGNRIGECWDLQEKIAELVPVGAEGCGEWYHMPSKANAADRPTRLDTKVEEIQMGSVWQDGMSAYLKQPFCDWPWETNFAKLKVVDVVPREELVSKYRGVAGTTKVENAEINFIEEKFDGGYITNDYDELIDKTEPLFRWLARMRARDRVDHLTFTSRDLAFRFLFRLAMPATRLALAAGRLGELTIVEEHDLLVIRGRAAAGMMVLLGMDFLPVLMSSEKGFHPYHAQESC